MSALEQAIAGRPGWMMQIGQARYAHEGTDRIALITPNEDLGGFDCEIRDGGILVDEWFEAAAVEAVAYAERMADQP